MIPELYRVPSRPRRNKFAFFAAFMVMSAKRNGSILSVSSNRYTGGEGLSPIALLRRTWGGMWGSYCESIPEGVRALVRILQDGANRDALAALPLSPYKHRKRCIWRWPSIFSYASSEIMRQGRILTELVDQLGKPRIQGAQIRRPFREMPTPAPA